MPSMASSRRGLRIVPLSMVVHWKGKSTDPRYGPVEAQTNLPPCLARSGNGHAVALHIARAAGNVGADIAGGSLERTAADIGAVGNRRDIFAVATTPCNGYLRQAVVGHVVIRLL